MMFAFVEIILNVAGYWLQVAGCMFPVQCPFVSRKEYKKQRRKAIHSVLMSWRLCVKTFY